MKMNIDKTDILNYLHLNTSHIMMITKSQDTEINNTQCVVSNSYYNFEAYCYLFIMCPLALIGIVLNLISLRVFQDKSFNSVTFKYLRLITLTDCFICIIIIPYCVTSYTQPFNKYDLYLRHLYLAYLYIPGANFAINLSTLLNLLVTIERLISVGWPTHKYTLFKPSRYYLSCFIVLFIAIISNIANFLLYKVEICIGVMTRSFTTESWWTVYGFVKEVLTRILPIVLLIISNIVLIYIVKSSRKRMKESVSISYSNGSNAKNVDKKLSVFKCFGSDKKKYTHEIIDSSNKLLKNTAVKRNRQENQLTWMTIFVAILYSVTSIPMVFAYPGLIFKAEQTITKMYKTYAVLVNILELIQCSFRFLVYYCFTTQFRQVFYTMYGGGERKKSNVIELNNIE